MILKCRAFTSSELSSVDEGVSVRTKGNLKPANLRAFPSKSSTCCVCSLPAHTPLYHAAPCTLARASSVTQLALVNARHQHRFFIQLLHS